MHDFQGQREEEEEIIEVQRNAKETPREFRHK